MSVVPIQGVGVYHDSDTSRWHFDQLNEHSFRFNHGDYYNDLPLFLNNSYSVKFAGYHVPFPEDRTWITRFHQTYQQVNHTFIFCSELHDDTVAQLEELDLPSVSIFICGIINGYEFKNAQVHRWMDWFHTTSYNYRMYYPELLPSKLLPQENKTKYFDALLGCRRPNREYVYKQITENGLESKFIMTMLNEQNQIPMGDCPENFIMETEGLEFLSGRSLQYTVNPVRYYGKEMSLSQIVPISVYNQTYYSIVTETNSSNHYNFFTEKTVKPLMAGRLIVVFAGQHFLRSLQNMGFKTFGSIIDESYDAEPNTEKRREMALEQVKILCSLNPVEVCRIIEPIVEHNKKMVLEYDWYNEFSLSLAQTINQYLTADHKVFG